MFGSSSMIELLSSGREEVLHIPDLDSYKSGFRLLLKVSFQFSSCPCQNGELKKKLMSNGEKGN